MANSIERKVRKKKIGLITILLIFLTSTFIILSTKTDFFNVSEIIVQGNNVLDYEKVILASGLNYGENIFKIRTKEAKENILSHPYVKSVNIKRVFPNKLAITIEERKETLIIPYLESYIYLDDEGYVLNLLAYKKEGLLEVEGININSISIGKKLLLEDNVDLEKIIDLIKDCKKIDLYREIEKVKLDNKSNVVIYLKSGIKVAFGHLNNVKYKLSFTIKILDDLKRKGISKGTIHFDKGDSPIFIPEGN
ncbi:cell division protein FtsQ [Caloranaerobacter azorensis DSM 13643]|uniref:Cell division protein FtsQ n=1 Tax=Caloranaerobacter azorensis DSM 13643 TaxID=1121264 RepID=A0A1M5U208_9FIRM|nr:FtsQ-type POTRA domain-containing protein [Caloranaerobacter azorensis]SHH57067.1 cell division protein FtsQ [Caloranaerobacter azorensis DSM 13643]